MEILIAISIFGLITIGIVIFAFDISQSQIFLGESLESEEDIKQALEIIAPEIRSITTSNNGSYPIVAASSSSFNFFSDINSDGLVEKVRYFFEDNEFKKGTIVPTLNPIIYDPVSEKVTVLASDVISANTFSYYDENYDGNQPSLTIPIDVSKIRSVRVELMVDQNPLTPPLPAKINTFVDIRNLRGI